MRLWTGAGLQVCHVYVEFSCLFLLPCHTSSTSMVFQWTISIMRTYFQKSEDNNKKGNFINAPKHLQGGGVGTPHEPHSARSCELALHAVGAAGGRPGWTPLAWVWGVRGRALSHPRPPVLPGVLPGPITHWLRVRGVWAWGPVTNPTARSCELASCAVGAARGGPGGGASCLGVGRPGSGALPAPTARPFGRAAGAHYPPHRFLKPKVLVYSKN